MRLRPFGSFDAAELLESLAARQEDERSDERTFERSIGDILALPSDVAHAIATQIGIALSPHEAVRLAKPRTVLSAAYEAYLKGRYYWKRRSRDALQTSVQYFKAGDRARPGVCAGLRGPGGRVPHAIGRQPPPAAPEAFSLADEALRDALRLDDTLAEPHTSLGHLRLHQLERTSAEGAF